MAVPPAIHDGDHDSRSIHGEASHAAAKSRIEVGHWRRPADLHVA